MEESEKLRALVVELEEERDEDEEEHTDGGKDSVVAVVETGGQ